MVTLCFGGILRAGEALNAFRYDLLLPRDTADTNNFALLWRFLNRKQDIQRLGINAVKLMHQTSLEFLTWLLDIWVNNNDFGLFQARLFATALNLFVLLFGWM